MIDEQNKIKERIYMKIAFFDTKPYDRPAFDAYGNAHGVQFKYFETKYVRKY